MKQLSHSLLLFTSLAIVILASCKKSGLQELSQDNPNSNESIFHNNLFGVWWQLLFHDKGEKL